MPVRILINCSQNWLSIDKVQSNSSFQKFKYITVNCVNLDFVTKVICNLSKVPTEERQIFRREFSKKKKL